jgi:SAM-dependent methyltransferase
LETRFLIIKNERLNFRDSNEVVYDFIKKRIKYYGFDSVDFCESHTHAQLKINSLPDNSERFIVVSDAINPFLDIELVKKMISRIDGRDSSACVAIGAIPGTQPEFVARSDKAKEFLSDGLSPIELRWYSQAKYNNQFDLKKYKRLKMFMGLLKIMPDMYKKSIDEFCAILEEDRIFSRLISYCEDVELVYLKDCPYCSGNLEPLKPSMSQPLCGYLSPGRPYYYQCRICGLVVLSPHPSGDNAFSVCDDFDKQDFINSQNDPDAEIPAVLQSRSITYKSVVEGNARSDFSSFISLLPDRTHSLEIGGGLGRFSEFLRRKYPQWDVTHSDFNIVRRKRLKENGIRCLELDYLNKDIGSSEYDIIFAWEVVEHIPFEQFSDVIGKIYAALKPGGMFVFSTPDFDSPMTHVYDTYNACPPFHYTVFSTGWLTKYFSDLGGWKILMPRYSSDVLDGIEGWCDYASKTSPSFQLCGLSKILKEIFTIDCASDIKRKLLEKSCGTETIMTLIKNG